MHGTEFDKSLAKIELEYKFDECNWELRIIKTWNSFSRSFSFIDCRLKLVPLLRQPLLNIQLLHRE